MERIGDDAGVRPLLGDKDPLLAVTALLEKRRAAYARCAAAIGTDGLTPEQVAEETLSRLPEERS